MSFQILTFLNQALIVQSMLHWFFEKVLFSFKIVRFLRYKMFRFPIRRYILYFLNEARGENYHHLKIEKFSLELLNGEF